MVEYTAKSPVRAKAAEQVFGAREFVSPQGVPLSCGELIKYGDRYFAVIERTIYSTNFREHPNGKGWVVNI